MVSRSMFSSFPANYSPREARVTTFGGRKPTQHVLMRIRHQKICTITIGLRPLFLNQTCWASYEKAQKFGLLPTALFPHSPVSSIGKGSPIARAGDTCIPKWIFVIKRWSRQIDTHHLSAKSWLDGIFVKNSKFRVCRWRRRMVINLVIHFELPNSKNAIAVNPCVSWWAALFASAA